MIKVMMVGTYYNCAGELRESVSVEQEPFAEDYFKLLESIEGRGEGAINRLQPQDKDPLPSTDPQAAGATV